jgi:hypothetical protein
MEGSKLLVSETQKQLAGINERLSVNRDEKKQLLKLAKNLKLSLRLMGQDEGSAKKKPRRRTSKKSAPASAAA